ncbi:hypothetical protein HUG15_21520 [Salicibibacter cibarius]|uniref:DUF8042 domain-containing protein n=2 Tax=Salicibibacter cibarius TaxID=2743000 RepID=A0A7T6Z6U1_9BACI|nr:hypothetical protein HUG15_21520 [Salicibibacter cibarius]
MFKKVNFTCERLINEMEDSLRTMEQNSKEQMLPLFEQMMDSYEQLEMTALTIEGYRQKGNIKARLTRVKRELQDAKTAVEFKQFEKAEEMLEHHLIPALKRFQEGLFPK